MNMNISERCQNCGGEDCVCCEVYIEHQADQKYDDSWMEE